MRRINLKEARSQLEELKRLQGEKIPFSMWLPLWNRPAKSAQLFIGAFQKAKS